MDAPATDWTDIDFRNNFETLLTAGEEDNKGSLRKTWTKAKIEEVINNMKKSKIARTTGMKLKSMEYYWSSKYEYISENGEDYLIFKKKNPEDPTVRIIAREDFFDVLKPIHISCGHGGRDKMQKKLKNQFYIPKKAIEIFSSHCPVCGPKKNHSFEHKKNKDGHSIDVLAELNNKGVVDLIDFQSYPDGEFKWLLKYQECATKFFSFRPLKTKEATEIAMELTKIFLTFGPPDVLQSLTGGECVDEILKEIRKIWPDCKTINGSNNIINQSIQSQTVRNNSIVNMLCSWMNDNNFSNWSIGCFFFQYHKNISTNAYGDLFRRRLRHNSSSLLESSQLITSDETHSLPTTLSNSGYSCPNELQKNETTHLIAVDGQNNMLPKSNNEPTLYDEEDQPPNTQLEPQDIKEEFKMEIVESEISIEQHDYITETNFSNSSTAPELDINVSSNLDIQYPQFERKHCENFKIDEHYQFDYQLKVECTDANTADVERNNDLDLDNNVKIKFNNIKTEPIEEADRLKITCAVCECVTFVEHTILCFNCNNNIHKTCAKSVTDQVYDSKALCYMCFDKLVPELDNKEGVTSKAIKRVAVETVVSNAAKRVPPTAASGYVPGTSGDQGYMKHFIDFVGVDRNSF